MVVVRVRVAVAVGVVVALLMMMAIGGGEHATFLVVSDVAVFVIV